MPVLQGAPRPVWTGPYNPNIGKARQWCRGASDSNHSWQMLAFSLSPMLPGWKLIYAGFWQCISKPNSKVTVPRAAANKATKSGLDLNALREYENRGETQSLFFLQNVSWLLLLCLLNKFCDEIKERCCTFWIVFFLARQNEPSSRHKFLGFARDLQHFKLSGCSSEHFVATSPAVILQPVIFTATQFWSTVSNVCFPFKNIYLNVKFQNNEKERNKWVFPTQKTHLFTKVAFSVHSRGSFALIYLPRSSPKLKGYVLDITLLKGDIWRIQQTPLY